MKEWQKPNIELGDKDAIDKVIKTKKLIEGKSLDEKEKFVKKDEIFERYSMILFE